MKARLLEFEDIGIEIRRFLFEVPELDRFTFVPGQFVSFSELLVGKKVTRAYSIASPPLIDNRFELCLNRVKEGVFSPYLFSMAPGDVIEMKGPLGGFVLKKPVRDSVLVATGTGIAPIRSILLAHVPHETEHRFTLIYGVRYTVNLLYAGDFERLARERPNFRFLPAVTRPDEQWRGLSGRVQPVMLEVIGERRDLDVYVCGLREMVDDVRARLKEMGFDRKQIIYERYD